VGFARAGVAEDHDRFAGVDPGQAGQVGQRRWWQAGQGGQVQVLEAFGAWELCLQDPADTAARVAVVALGGEDLGQERAVREPFPGRGVGDVSGLCPDGGQVQGGAGCADGGLGGRVGQRGHRRQRGRGGRVAAGAHAEAPDSSSS
jgi:hypothetical protein